MASSLQRCKAALSAAEATCAAASTINLESSQPREPFKVVQIASSDVLRVPSKAEQLALADNAKLKDVLIALRTVVPEDKRDALDMMDHEADDVVGKVAELKAQAAEVADAAFVERRVEDATMQQQDEARSAEDAHREAVAALARKQAELQSLEEELTQLAGRKRIRENDAAEAAAAAAAAAGADPGDLQMALVATQVAEAEAEAAVAVAKQKLKQSTARRAAVGADVVRAREESQGRRAAEEEGRRALEREPEFRAQGERVQQLGEAAEAAARAKERAEGEGEELRGALRRVTGAMSVEGHVGAMALQILVDAAGETPLKQLKEALAARIEASSGDRSGTPVSQQVLETVYALVSASLISIDRTSPQQNVSTCL